MMQKGHGGMISPRPILGSNAFLIHLFYMNVIIGCCLSNQGCRDIAGNACNNSR